MTEVTFHKKKRGWTVLSTLFVVPCLLAGYEFRILFALSSRTSVM